METVSILLKLFFCYQDITVIGHNKHYYKHAQNKPTKKTPLSKKRKINDRKSKKFYFVVNKCVKVTLKKGYV